MDYNDNTNWFKDAGYGVFIHYLNRKNDMVGDWNQTVNAFDCRVFAEQMEEAGAAYVVFSLGQCCGYFCSPNATYQSHLNSAGISDKLCPDRDLISDLYDELSIKGIKLLLYAAAPGPAEHPAAGPAFGWDFDDPANDTFRDLWFACLREWSLRYGEKVSGWWIDGCYSHYSGFFQPGAWQEFSAALKAGNPKAIVAYNQGIGVGKITDFQDYTAGEANGLDYRPAARWYEGLQWHVLTYLGYWWGEPECKYTNKELVDYISECKSNGGVVTLDVAVYRNGKISGDQLEQLKILKKVLSGNTACVCINIPENPNYIDITKSYSNQSIPEGFVNIAPNKPAIASSVYCSEYTQTMAADGDTMTGWASAATDPCPWYQLDLGNVHCIRGIQLVTRQDVDMGAYSRRHFEVRVSNDQDFKTYEVAGAQKNIPMPYKAIWSVVFNDGLPYRYVRVAATRRIQLFIAELRVYILPEI